MKKEKSKIVLNNYNNLFDLIEEQNEFYTNFSQQTQCKTTLDVFEKIKPDSTNEIRNSMHNLQVNSADFYNQLRFIKQLAYYQDILIDERSSIRIEKRYCQICFEYDKLLLKIINQTQSLINVLIRI